MKILIQKTFILLFILIAHFAAQSQNWYKTSIAGNWSVPSTWLYSSNGGVTYGSATTAPTIANADSILIINPVTLDANISINKLRIFSTGSLNFNGYNLTITHVAGNDLWVYGQGALLVNNGTLTNNGQVQIDKTITLTSGTITGTGNMLIKGTLNWSGGDIYESGIITVAPTGMMSLSGLGVKYYDNGTINNNGLFIITTDGAFQMESNATFNNLATGEFEIISNAPINNYGTTTFNNSGVLIKNVATGTSSFYPTFNNSGSIIINTGSISFGGTANSTGIIKSRSTSAFAVAGGTFNLNLNSTIADSTTINLSGGTLAIKDATNGLTLLPNTTLNMIGGLLNVSTKIYEQGTTNWSSNGTSGTGVFEIETNGKMNLSSTTTKNLDYSILSNFGTITFIDGGTFYIEDGAVFNNQASGLILLNSSTNITPYVAATFTNAGTLRKIGSTTATIGLSLNNSGLLDMQQGTLNLSSGGTYSGSFNIAKGAQLLFNGTNNFNDGSSFNDACSINLVSGTFNFNHAAGLTILPHDTVNFSNGKITVANQLTIQCLFNWSAGTLAGINGGSSVLTFAPTSNFVYLTSSTKNIDYLTLNNSGTVIMNTAGTLYIEYNSVFNNLAAGTILAPGNISIANYSVGTFNNAGKFIKNGNNTISFAMPFNNTGTMQITIGTLLLNNGGTFAGALKISPGAITNFEGGTSNFNDGFSLKDSTSLNLIGGTNNFNQTSTGLILAAHDTVNFVGGNLYITNHLQINGIFNWTVSTINGVSSTATALDLYGTSNIYTTNTKYLSNITVNNYGTFNMTDNYTFYIEYNSKFYNQSSGVLNITANPTITEYSTGYFENKGIMKKNSTGTVTFSTAFNNSGTFYNYAGTLQVSNGGSGTGNYRILNGSSINFNYGTYTFNDGANFNDTCSITFSGGTISIGTINSPLNIKQNTTLNLGTTLTLAANASMKLDGTMNFTNGTISGTGTINASSLATINLSTTSYKYLDATIKCAGTTNFTGTGTFEIENGGVFENSAGGTFNLLNDATINQYYTNTFNNYGQVIKKNTTGVSTINVVFNNYGTISANSGSISLSSGGTSSGIFKTSSIGTIALSGGTYTIGNGATIADSTVMAFSGGTVNVNAPTSGVTFPVHTTLSISNTTNIVGTTNLYFNGILNFTSGTIAGTGSILASSTSTINLSSTSYKYLDATIKCAGTTNFIGSNLQIENGGVFENSAGGTFNLLSDGSISQYYTNTFNNYGQVIKKNTTGVSTINVVFNNYGTITANSGSINLNNGGTSTGIFKTSALGTISFTGGTYNLTTGTAIADSSVIAFSSGTVNVNAPASTIIFPANTTLTISTNTNIVGTSNLNVNGILNFTSGDIAGTGTINASSTSTINISSTSYKYLDATIKSAGITNLSSTGTFQIENGGVFENSIGGTFNLLSNAMINQYYVGAFNNYGQLIKKGTTGQSTINVVCNNYGTVNANAGTISLGNGGTSTGTFQTSSAGVISFSSGTYNLTTGTTITDSTNMTFNSGTINVNAPTSGLTFPKMSTLNISTQTNIVGTTNLNLNGTMNFTSGDIAGAGIINAASTSTININSSSYKYLDATIKCAGTTNLSGTGTFEIENGGVFENSVGGTFNLLSDALINSYYTATFNNYGQFIKNGTTGQTSINPVFNNYGSVVANTGHIGIFGGGASTGSFKSAPAATLLFNSAVYTFNNGSSIADSSYISLVGSTMNFNSTAGLALPLNATLVFNGSTVNITNQLTINGTLIWTVGSVSGTGLLSISNTGTANITTTNYRYLYNEMDNYGTINFVDNMNFQLQNSNSILKNLASGTINILSTPAITLYTAGSLINAGTIIKKTNTGAASLNLPLTNTGFIDVQAGSITLNATSRLSGHINTAAGTSFNTYNVPLTLSDTAVWSGAGTFLLAQSYTINAGGRFSLAGGTLTGAGNLTVNGTFAIGDAKVALTNNLIYGTNATLEYNGDTAKFTTDKEFPPTNSPKNLTINGTNTTKLHAARTINGTFANLNGLLDIGNFVFSLGASSVLSGTPSETSMVVSSGTGEFRRYIPAIGSYLYPIGNIATLAIQASYSPINLTFTTGTFNNAYVGITVSNTKHPSNPSTTNYLNRYWKFNSNGISNFNCNISAQYEAFDVVGIEKRVQGGALNGTNWNLFAKTNFQTHTLTGTVNTFSDFTGVDFCHFTSAPVVSSQTKNINACLNDNLSLIVTATGSAPLNYTWYLSESNLNVNNDTLLINQSTFTNNGSYNVVISDFCDRTTSSAMIPVTINPLPTANFSGDATICPTCEAAINVSLTGQAPWDLIYTIGTTNNYDTITSIPYFLTAKIQGVYTPTSVKDANGCKSTTTGTTTTITIDPNFFANAGNSDTICSSTATLNGNNPGQFTGTWTVVTGAALFANKTFYNTAVTNLSQGENIFKWTLYNGSTYTSDIVKVYNFTPTTAIAGKDTNTCLKFINISANQPVYGIGTWSVYSSAFFDDVHNPNTTVRGLATGNNYIYWTINNSICSSTDSMLIYNKGPYANAGVAQNIYTIEPILPAGSAIMTAIKPPTGTGVWSVISGATIFTNQTLYNTEAHNFALHDNVLQWKVTNQCGSDSDQVIITRGIYYVSNSATFDWNKSTNWVPPGVPSANDSVAIGNGATNVNVNVSNGLGKVTITGSGITLTTDSAVHISQFTVIATNTALVTKDSTVISFLIVKTGSGLTITQSGKGAQIRTSSITVEPETSKLSGGKLSLSKGASITVEPETSKGGTSGDGNITIMNGGTLELLDNSSITMPTRPAKGSAPSGNISIGSKSTLTLGTGSSITVEPETSKALNPGSANITIGSGASVTLSSGSKITVEPETSKATTPNVRNLSVSSGANITMNKGSSITVEPETSKSGLSSGMINIMSGASIIDQNDTSKIRGRFMVNYNFAANKKTFVSVPLNAANNAFSNTFLQTWTENVHQWVNVTTPNLKKLLGYAVIYNKDTIVGVSDTLLNAGLQNVSNFTYTTIGSPIIDQDGCNFTGNPYPSGINWDTSAIVKTNIYNTVYLWYNGNFSVYQGKTATTAGIGINGGSPYINPLTAFWVYRKTGVTGSSGVSFGNAARVHINTVAYTPQPVPNLVRMKVQTTNYSDETVVRFVSTKNTEGYSGDYDALKKFSPLTAVPQIFSLSSTDTLSIQGLTGATNVETKVPVGFRAFADGNYTIQITEFRFNVDTAVYLKDLVTNAMTNLKTHNSYTFNYKKGDNPMRFQLIFNPKWSDIPKDINQTGVNIYAVQNQIFVNSNNAIKTEIYICDILGRCITSTTSNESTTRININRPAGYYVVRVKTGNTVVSRKIFISN